MYWQRALSAKTVRVAEILSFIAAFGCVFMAVPAVLLGAVAKSTSEYREVRFMPDPPENSHLTVKKVPKT